LRKSQIIAVLTLVFLLVAYGIYVKLDEEFNFNFTFDNGHQFYSPDEPPDQIYFAGESVPLDDKKVYRRFGKELKQQTFWNPARAALLNRVNYWMPQMSPILKQYKIPDDLKYLSVVESGLQNVQSYARAGGFWQILPETAVTYDLEINDEVDERYHPILATHAACKYLSDAHRLFGSWTSAAASYNLGMNGMTQAMLRQRKDSFYQLRLNSQTTDYIFRIIAVKQLIEHPKEYGYRVSRYSTLNSALRTVRVTTSVPNLTVFARRYGISYQTLRMYNPWIKRNSLTIKRANRGYTLLLPRRGMKMPMQAMKMALPDATETAIKVGTDTSEVNQ
jgi:membrane-bound lytic murein transglycosylase D